MPCKRGHRLYDRTNHCVQFRSQSIHHKAIHARDAFVYIAFARTRRLHHRITPVRAALRAGTEDEDIGV